jgi:hypothetical protein
MISAPSAIKSPTRSTITFSLRLVVRIVNIVDFIGLVDFVSICAFIDIIDVVWLLRLQGQSDSRHAFLDLPRQ